MKKVSLISPLWNEVSILESSLKELESFVAKFPLEWELLLVVDPSRDGSLEKAKSLKSDKFQVQVLPNPTKLGRGRSVLRGLQQAKGDYVVVFPLDFTIPMADLFNFLQELVVNPDIDLIIGNRNTSRKKREAQKSSWHWTLEKIINEKLVQQKLAIPDPLCGYIAFPQAALQKILPELKMKSWYYTPEILLLAMKKNFKIVEVPVLSRDSRASKIPLFKEYLRNLF